MQNFFHETRALFAFNKNLAPSFYRRSSINSLFIALKELSPVQRPIRLVLGDARFEEVTLFLQVDHPREGEDLYHL
jgi:hypothetical protein